MHAPLRLAILASLIPALLPAAPALPEPAWWLEPLGIPEPGEALLDGASPVPPAAPGDDVIVPVPRNQNEYAVAVNPLDPNHLVAGANDYSLGDAWAGWFVSRDGGATWKHGYIPLPSLYTVSGDPAIAFGPDGTVYYAGIAFNRGSTNNGANAIFVARSDDGGLTWATSTPFSSPVGDVFHDKPYIATDPATGALYLTYTHFGPGGGISFSRSLDRGATWSPRLVIGSGQFSLPVAGTKGEVYVTWASSGAWFAASTDGGSTWQARRVLPLGLGQLPLPFRYFSYPVMDVARGGPFEGRIYLAGPGAGGATGPDLRVVHSDDGGATWSQPEVLRRPGAQLMPWMAIQPDGTVGIVYMDTALSAALQYTEGPGTHLVQSLSVKGPLEPAFTTMVLTDESSPASATSFWGDYQGLAASPRGFHPAFGDARASGPCACVGDALLDFGTMRVPGLLSLAG